jgi:YD repeat-containing protein
VAAPVTQRNITKQLGTSGPQFRKVYYYDANTALLTEEDDYDVANGTPTTILRKTIVTYALLGNGIVDRPASVTICNGTGSSSSCNGQSGSSTGTVVSQTTYTYDQGTPATSSGTPQHTSVTGSRGNATTIASLVAGSTTLSRTFTYYDTGMLKTATDVNNATITYNYPNATTTCGNAFATSIAEPIGNMTRSFTWNCGGGVQLTAVDENGKTTTFAYASDPYYWRKDSVTDPTGAAVNFCYGLLSGTTCTRNATQVESYLNFNSGNSSVDTLTTVDGLARPHVVQTRKGPSSTSSNFDTVETDYDALGRVSKVTLPFSAAAGGTSSSAPGTSTQYDPLNRFTSVTDSGGGSTAYTYYPNNDDVLVSRGPQPSGENLKKRQFEYDGLGRVISVCEVTSGTSTYPGGNCAQQNPQTGYYTTYSYDANGNLLAVTQNAQAASGSQQTRSYTYDGLSRLTSETNPEIGPSSASAPINYTYDSGGTCGSSAGDRVKKVDPQGNTVCFAYDLLHRNTSIAYSGSYASVTPNRYFVYDAATVNGVQMSNVMNRLAEAYTSASQSGTKITDEGFSYTLRGEVSDLYQ